MSRTAAGNRHNTRELGRFTSQATLRANQRLLLAPVARWRKEPVKLGNSNIRVVKWVKYLDEGVGDETDQVTEEQLSAAVTGAQTFLQPSNPTPGVGTSAANTPQPGTPSGAAGPTNTNTPLASGSGVATGVSTPATLNAQPLASTSSTLLRHEFKPEDLETEMAAAQQPGMSGESSGVTLQESQEEPPAAITGTDAEAGQPSTNPGREDDGHNMQVEVEQREHDVTIAPELVGPEGEASRIALGVGDPIEGGPAEIDATQ